MVDRMSSVSISIRPATAADGAAVLDLAPRLTEGVAPWRDQARALAAARSWLTGSLTDAADGTGIVFVATSPPAPGVLGVLSVRPTRHFTGEQDGYIGELAVAEHAARQGIGRALIDAAEFWARDAGLANLTLHTGSYNTSARAFYAALGFAEEEVRLTRPVSVAPTPG
jgi:ribosomal protein S18 acetylase RimI-like enzyme